MYFWLTSAPSDFESAKSIKNDSITRPFLVFWPTLAPRSGRFPHCTCRIFGDGEGRLLHQTTHATGSTYFTRFRKRSSDILKGAFT
ncbi:hypothetical protein CJT82_17115 [Pseudomonas aeruginosa]|nr:hypothetical protein CJT83_27010 [Pseudomonas aeruginosa]PBX28903.1 hypothetical protein CJT82_17115 [Pseudomonas aeruginosa]